jgi:hypothetical protein
MPKKADTMGMFSRRGCSPILLFCLLAFGGSNLGATHLQPLSIEQLAEKSQVIIHGTVLSKSCQRDPQGRIYTKVQLQIAEAWKGSGDGFVLVHSGGVLGNESSGASGQESFDVGEEVVVFVVLNKRGEGVTLGLAQGKFHVSLDVASGQKLAHNPFHGRGPEIDGSKAPAAKKSLSLSELKQRVKGARP